MNNLKITLLLCAIMLSCNTEEDKGQDVNLSIKNNYLEIKLNNETSNISRGLQAYSNADSEFLFNINWNRNSLQIYDIGSGETIQEIFFATEGEDAVGRIFGFHVQSMDSIFLFSQQKAEIVLIDTANTIKSRISYKAPDGYSNAFVHNAYFISRPSLNENQLIVKTHLQSNYREMTAKELQKKSIIYSIDVESGAVDLWTVNYPKDYLDNGLKLYEYSLASNAKQSVFSFFGDHRLFYTKRGAELKSKTVKSKYLDDNLPLFPLNGTREATYGYLYASDHYESLLYDKFRNIYYRFAFPKQQYKDMEQLMQLKEAPQSFSIMVLDENLDIVGERLFDANRLVPNNVFVGEEGLYISTSHPDNSEIEENKMVFDLIGVNR